MYMYIYMHICLFVLQVYDNACNAAEYMANREPNFMKTGRLVVDRFHEKNHTTCSRGYNSDKYPNLLGTNTQRCEQLNSEFKRLKGMISYCKPESAWKIMTLYMATKNYFRACSEGKTLPIE